jgi:hypothetical protein
MRSRPFILRCVAFLLILVFSQKAGAGLFLHNLFHNTTANSKTQEQGNEKGKDFSYNCTCIDDFLMPFAEAEKVVYAQPPLIPATPFTFFEDNIPFHTPIFSCLRGPPTNWL